MLHPNQGELISGQQNGSIMMWDLAANKCSDSRVRSIMMLDVCLFVLARSHRVERRFPMARLRFVR